MARGRRPGVSNAEKVFRKQFASALAAAIGSERGAQSRAAEQLGVKRQLVSLYLKGHTTPGRDLVRRAAELWGVTLNYGGIPVSPASFPRTRAPRVIPQQLKLFCEDQQLRIEVMRRSVDSVELKVSINFKK